jgi:hypothetical protein
MTREEIINMIRNSPKGRLASASNISRKVAYVTGYKYDTVRRVLTGTQKCTTPHHERWFDLAAVYLTNNIERKGEE